MYFWNIDALKKQIVTEGLSEKDRLLYLLADVATMAVIGEFPTYFPETQIPNNWTYLLSALNVIIWIGGVFYVFCANGGVAGTGFLDKYMSIGWVTTIRFLVFAIPLVVVFLWLYLGSGDELNEDNSDTFFDVLLVSLFQIAYFIYFAKHIRDLRIGIR